MADQAVKFANESKGIIEGLAIPFGGPIAGKDLDGEYFDKSTDFCLDWFPSGRPLLYHHGRDDSLKTAVIGRQFEHEIRDDGVWVQSQLETAQKYRQHVDRLIGEGALGFSSGAVPHLVSTEKNGHISRWPWVELSTTPTPANPGAVVYAVKSIDALAHHEAIDADVAAPLAAALKALDEWSSTLPEITAGPLAGSTFADHSDRVLTEVKALVDRSTALAAVRGQSRGAKAALSAENRSRLQTLVEQLWTVASDVEALLRITDPAAADRGQEAMDALAEFVRIEAAMNGVGSLG